MASQTVRNLVTYAREWLMLRLWWALLAVLLFGMIAGRASAATPPTIDLQVSIAPGNIPTLTWSAPWASACTASGGWSGVKAASGSEAVAKVTASTSYSLDCTGIVDTTATLVWTAPTMNTDGSTLTNLAGFRIYQGTAANSLAMKQQIADPATLTYQAVNLPAGTAYFAVSAYNSQGVESALSAVGSKTITGVPIASASVTVDVPNAPVLTVQDPTAFDVRRRGLHFSVNRDVGTVPVGTQCSADFTLPGGFFRVNRKDVDFKIHTRSPVIVARCA